MNYTVSERYNTVILTFKGKIMGGPEASVFQEMIADLIEKDKTHVVGDLSKVSFMNSSGLGIIITALTSLRKAGGDLKICGASDRIESLLMVTKLITVFDHHRSLDNAVNAFQS